MPHAGESLARVGQLGVLQSVSGQGLFAHLTPTAFFSVPSTINGLYLVTCGLNAADPTNYSAVSIVSMDRGVLRTTALQTAPLMVITVSGTNIVVEQRSGGVPPTYWTVLRIS